MTPEQAAQHVSRASEFIQSGDYVAAVEEARSALAIEPTNIDAMSVLGIALSRSGRWAEAEVALRQAVANRADALTHYNLAAHLFAAGKLEAAGEHARSALQYDPAHEASAALLRNIDYQRSQQPQQPMGPAPQARPVYGPSPQPAAPEPPRPFGFIQSLGWAWVVLGAFLVFAQLVTRGLLIVRLAELGVGSGGASEAEELAMVQDFMTQSAGLLIGYGVWFFLIACWWILDYAHQRQPRLLAFTIIGILDAAILGCCTYGVLTLAMFVTYLILSRKKPIQPLYR